MERVELHPSKVNIVLGCEVAKSVRGCCIHGDRGLCERSKLCSPVLLITGPGKACVSLTLE